MVQILLGPSQFQHLGKGKLKGCAQVMWVCGNKEEKWEKMTRGDWQGRKTQEKPASAMMCLSEGW